ncbi:hypothetical protein CC85DRAFT_288059 [Cutaneotrichosporon oleaginosum]|uniref:Uncharacterized protein n=1 Tax=Cutaneotrichosporon oleaginosum TaxID=879819 RepID=A0A0J0XFN9_9TREE|nr:uncharacterized protein CC85DRAFT_288059 [Cutaneotrichosporon oleaginosum]KLT39881.1 hypothetical protein CC85DRAFT_288059 [Cutaneotrichosporon oleaginosum]
MSEGTGIVLEYALRVACLHEEIERRRRIAVSAPPSELGSVTASSKSQDSSSGFSLDLGSLLGRDSARSPRYPEKFIKVLDGSLQRIAMGQDPKHTDQRFRRSVALFWSSSWADKTFQRQLKESRKVEDIILAFVSASTRALKKELDLVDGGWKVELNSQILVFLDMLSDNLNSIGSAAVELRSRLSTYRTRLQDDNRRSVAPAPSALKEEVSVAVPSSDSTLSTRVVAELFQLDSATLAERLQAIRPICTVDAALEDLKIFLQRLSTDRSTPYGAKDFPDESQWAAYRGKEIAALSDLTFSMLKADPLMANERSDQVDLVQSVDGLKLDDRNFTFVPSDPREVYRQLLRECLDYDLQVLRTLPEDQDVSLSILSPEHTALLDECALRWRIPSSFRAWVFFEAIEDHYEQGDVPPDCVFEAVGGIGRVSQDFPVSDWAETDQAGLQAALLRRDLFFLNDIDISLNTPTGYMSPEFRQAVDHWGNLGADQNEHPAFLRTQRAICDRLRQQAYARYIEEASEKYAQEGGKNKRFAAALAAWIESSAKRLNKWFPDPLLPQIDVVSLVLHQQLSLWVRDLEEAMASPNDSLLGPSDDFEESLAMYHRAQKLQSMGVAFGMDPSQFALSSIFEPVISAWLDETAVKMRQWADNALRIDDFSPLTANGHSSSVTDLFASFQSAMSFLLDLEWDDPEQMAAFATRLAKIISLSIDDYCTKLERLFSAEMNQTESHQSTAKQKAWIEKARSTIAHLQGDRKIQAFFNFTPASCVKLNNIDAARHELDQLYREMRVDEYASLDVNKPVVATVQEASLFTIKIVLGEDLVVEGSSRAPDAFVVLSDEHGNRYAKTRTIYDDHDPRWDETFDVAVRRPAWFMVTVRHRNLAGKHDLIGRAYLQLDPSQYVDLISKDVLLPLSTKGHVLLRVSMEGERDDIQFHFGRAFRWLKRTESDMVRLFVDKMTPVLRHTLSRSAIKSVLKPSVGGIDYNDALRFSNDALGRISAAYRSAVGTGQDKYSIPLPPSEQAKGSPQHIRRGPSDAEIEAAIHPLFDYLDTNNHTLASTLSPDAMHMVMAKLWKQILMTIEALIVPPLSDKPSSMPPLSESELDVALRWLKFLRDFFYAGGDDSGVPLSTLQNAKFNEIMSVPIYYDWSTDDLMEECIRGFQSTLKSKAMKPSKSIIGQRNLGTIRARKTAKRSAPQASNHTELIMKILRMREGTHEFLAQQIQTLNAVKLEDTGRAKNKSRRGVGLRG